MAENSPGSSGGARRVRSVAVYVALAAALCLSLLWWWSWPALTRPYAAPAAPMIAVSQPASDAVTARMWISSARVYRDDSMRVDVEWENSSDEAVENLHFLDFRAPGFEQTGACWARNQYYPSCTGSSDTAASVPTVLRPGESLHVWAYLKPSVASGRFGLLALYGWSDGKKSAATGKTASFNRSASVTLQPIEITSPVHEAVGTVEGLMQGLLLPIVVSVLAWRFQRIEKDRETQRNKLEKEQAELHSERETERARQHEVWKEQLERMFTYTQEHYSHIARSIFSLTQSPKESAYQERVFYYFLMFWLQVRGLRDRRGGWFFSTKSGEDTFSSGWAILIRHMRDNLDYPCLETAVQIIGKPESLPEFKKRFKKIAYSEAEREAATQLAEIEDHFLLWVRKPDSSFLNVLAVLEILRHVLRFEWDRPFYGYWYGEQPSFPYAECEEALHRIPASPSNLVGKFREDFARYKRGTQAFFESKRLNDKLLRLESPASVEESKV